MNRSRVTGDLASHGNIFVDIANDRVGIGSTIPGEKLSLPDSAKIALGDSADFQLYHTSSGGSLFNSTGYIHIRASSNQVYIDGTTVHLRNHAGSETFLKGIANGAVELRYDNVKKFETTANGAAISNIPNNQGLNLNGTGNNTGIKFMSTGSSPAHSYRVNFHSTTGGLFNSPCLSFDKTATNGDFSGHIAGISDDGFHLTDNKKLHLGSSGSAGDLQIYHDGSHSFIDDIGTGNLKLRSNNFRVSNADESKISATFQAAGAVELYHNNSKKFETTAYGIDVTGTTGTDGLVVSGVATATTFSGALSGNATSATTTERVTVTNQTGDSSCNVLFAQSATGNQLPHTNANLTFNATNGRLTATSFAGDGSNLTSLNGSQISSGTVPVARIGTGTKNTSTFYRGDGTFATVTPPAITTINNASNNRVVTSDGGTTVTAESGLTYNGTTLQLAAADDIRIAGGAWTGEYTGGIKIQPDGSNSYFQYHGAMYFRNSAGANRFYFDSAGNATFVGSVTATGGFVNANATTLDGLDSTAFLRSNAADSASEKITFQANATHNQDTIASSTGSQGGIEIYNSGSGNDAFMAFHTGSDFAFYFGLDADTNDLSVGGWSMGAAKYRIWHAGNDGSGSGLDADTLDGLNSASFLRSDTSSSTNNTLTVQRLGFGGNGTNSGNTASAYAYNIFQESGTWTSPYPDLRIHFHTGIVLAANGSYGGIRFQRDYNDTTELFSVGNGDNHVRVANNLIVSGTLTVNGASVLTAADFPSQGTKITATGGNSVTTHSNHKIHDFVGSGTFEITAGAGEVEVLIVAGGGSEGGGGAGCHGGGGGGGGGVVNRFVTLGIGKYYVVVGAGGVFRNNGGNSSAFGFVALGGGAGGATLSANGNAGGSGGGGSRDNNSNMGGAATQPTSDAGGLGNAGGRTGPSNTSPGGGGGAGGPGATGNSGGAGGPGKQFTQFNNNTYFGAGGSSGGNANGAGNTGQGGGGSPGGGPRYSGGSGRVMIRYPV